MMSEKVVRKRTICSEETVATPVEEHCAEKSVFEKWRGSGILGMKPGREGADAFMRELRGYDDFDENA